MPAGKLPGRDRMRRSHAPEGKGVPMMDYEEVRKNALKSAVPVVAALFLVVASVAYIIYRTMSNRAYIEKWKDYDECGLS